jgi:RNA polymerase sigma-70 factor (ECF subfamily)
VLGAGAAAEDAAQEAVLRAWRQRDRCRDPDDPGPWLRRIAHNEAVRIVSRPSEAALDDAPEPAAHPGAGDPAAVLNGTVVRELVRTLGPIDRRLLFLQHWEDTPISEIASRMQMPEGTVKIRLHRARATLRRMMEDGQ